MRRALTLSDEQVSALWRFLEGLTLTREAIEPLAEVRLQVGHLEWERRIPPPVQSQASPPIPAKPFKVQVEPRPFTLTGTERRVLADGTEVPDGAI